MDSSYWGILPEFNPEQYFTTVNSETYHYTAYYTRIFVQQENHNCRPRYRNTIPWKGAETNIARIEWELMGDRMAWIVRGPGLIRFTSFSNVQNPMLATNWTYHDNGELTHASGFRVVKFHSETPQIPLKGELFTYFLFNLSNI